MRATEKEKLSSSHDHKEEDSTINIETLEKTKVKKEDKNEENDATHHHNEDDIQTQYHNSINDTLNNEHKLANDISRDPKYCSDTKGDEYSKGSDTNKLVVDEANDIILQHGQPESVKVEIHVTVNTASFSPSGNHGTLADLKKHRADMRTLMLTQGDISEKGHTFSATYMYDRPPSPTISLRRFCSDPSEVVGGEVHKQGCCILM